MFLIRRLFTAIGILFLFLFFNHNLYAQKDTIDLFGTRLLVHDQEYVGNELSSINYTYYLCHFANKFSVTRHMLPTTTPLSWATGGRHEQNYRSFVFNDTLKGYLEEAATAYFNNRQTKLNDLLPVGPGLYQFLNVPWEPNAILMAYVYEIQELYSTASRTYLRLDKLILHPNGIIDTGYMGIVQLNYIPAKDWLNDVEVNSGFIARTNDPTSCYLHLINGHDSTYNVFWIKWGRLYKQASIKDPVFFGSTISDPNISPNSKMVVLPEGIYNVARKFYLSELQDGKDNIPLDTFTMHTIDTTGMHIYSIQLYYGMPRYSPTGRFLYVPEFLDGKYVITKGLHKGDVIGYKTQTRLLQVDMAGVDKGGKPKVTVLKQWMQPMQGTEIFLHTVSADGKLYYCQRNIRIIDDGNKTADTSISLWRIDNPELEMDSNTFSRNITKVMDSLPFVLVYPHAETYNPASWAGYPYHAISKPSCSGALTTLGLHSIVPYDSVVWDLPPAAHRSMIWPDTAIYYAFGTQGNTDIKFHVWRKGYEDVIYTTVNIPGPAQRHQERRTLPHTITDCDKPVVLSPAKDSLAQKATWADGYKGISRTVSSSDTLVWQVWYDTTLCPRNDTVMVYTGALKNISLNSITTCDTVALLHIGNIQPHVTAVWKDGDSSMSRKIYKADAYTVHLADTISGCTKDISATVNFLKYTNPVWAGLDTSICEGGSITLNAPAQSQLRGLDGNATGNITITQSGIYNIGYRPESNTGANCEWKLAKVTVNVLSKDNDACQPKAACKWFLPNAFSPNADTKNEVWEPVSSCDNTTYELHIFNRWGERIFSSQDKGWNGQYEGADVPPGIYIYYITATNPDRSKEYRKGTIEVIR
jgi:gliding motility-associated-like protein